VVGVEDGDYESLTGTLDRIDSAGFDLVEMVLASPDDWDRYVAHSGRRSTVGWMRIPMIRTQGDSGVDPRRAAQLPRCRPPILRLGRVRDAKQILSHGHAPLVS
jgi:hypothetical protein